MASIVNGGLEEVAPSQTTVFFVQPLPTIHRAWHGHRMDPSLRHPVRICLREKFLGQPLRRPAGAVETDNLPGLAVAHNDEKIAANTVHHRLHYRQRRVGRNRRIDRIPTPRQNLRAGLRSQCLARRGNAALRNHHRSGLRTVLRECGHGHDDNECEAAKDVLRHRVTSILRVRQHPLVELVRNQDAICLGEAR